MVPFQIARAKKASSHEACTEIHSGGNLPTDCRILRVRLSGNIRAWSPGSDILSSRIRSSWAWMYRNNLCRCGHCFSRGTQVAHPSKVAKERARQPGSAALAEQRTQPNRAGLQPKDCPRQSAEERASRCPRIEDLPKTLDFFSGQLLRINQMGDRRGQRATGKLLRQRF